MPTNQPLVRLESFFIQQSGAVSTHPVSDRREPVSVEKWRHPNADAQVSGYRYRNISRFPKSRGGRTNHQPTHIDLIITADHEKGTAGVRMLDEAGNQLAFRQTDFRDISVSRQRGLFDLRDYLRNFVESGRERDAARDIGVCIAEDVLGSAIFQPLWESETQRPADSVT